jgi:hypothetical protein
MKLESLFTGLLVIVMISTGALGGMPGIIKSGHDSEQEIDTMSYQVTFQPPVIECNGDYAQVFVQEANQILMQEDLPVLPMFSKIIRLPFGAKITKIQPNEFTVYTVPLPKQIIPAEEPVPVTMEKIPDNKRDHSLYEEISCYPENWYASTQGVGIDEGQRFLFLTLQIYPVRYVASSNILEYITTMEFDISYETSLIQDNVQGIYDLLVICPDDWKEDLGELKNHKENQGIKTQVVSLADIVNESFFPLQGRDQAEQVKYFIKNALDDWGITYVLLVGGRKPGIREEWIMPVRYAHIYWADEERYISDLYFADIYDANYNFSSWDTDENNIFGEWKRTGFLKDDMDLYPDVYVGRWACRVKAELEIMIQKTISYEQGSTSKRVVLAGGDNFPQAGIEGEIVCDKTLEFLPGYDAEKIYVSEMDVTSKAMKNGLMQGSTFIHLHGHGSPIYWSTHKVGGDESEWEDGLKFYDLPLFFNNEYPIAIIGGCHTAMFNVSLTIHSWTGGIPAPEGISWWFARKPQGGAIASLGYTCFPVATPGESGDLDGDGIDEADCEESGYGYMQLQLVYAHGIEGDEYLGECWGYAVRAYADHFKTPASPHHFHTIMGFVLLGDPSLKIGGYGQ